MTTLFAVLLALSLLGVLIVLALGLTNLARAGSPRRSQMLQRARVVLQALALVALFGLIWSRS